MRQPQGWGGIAGNGTYDPPITPCTPITEAPIHPHKGLGVAEEGTNQRGGRLGDLQAGMWGSWPLLPSQSGTGHHPCPLQPLVPLYWWGDMAREQAKHPPAPGVLCSSSKGRKLLLQLINLTNCC